jgi:hypothetical protein
LRFAEKAAQVIVLTHSINKKYLELDKKKIMFNEMDFILKTITNMYYGFSNSTPKID